MSLPDQDPLSVSIYLKTSLSREDILGIIDCVTGGIRIGRLNDRIQSRHAEYYIDKNDEYSKGRMRQSGDKDFVYYPFIVGVDPLPNVIDKWKYTSEIRLIMLAIKKLDALARIVPACDFEDDLSM